MSGLSLLLPDYVDRDLDRRNRPSVLEPVFHAAVRLGQFPEAADGDRSARRCERVALEFPATMEQSSRAPYALRKAGTSIDSQLASAGAPCRFG